MPRARPRRGEREAERTAEGLLVAAARQHGRADLADLLRAAAEVAEARAIATRAPLDVQLARVVAWARQVADGGDGAPVVDVLSGIDPLAAPALRARQLVRAIETRLPARVDVLGLGAPEGPLLPWRLSAMLALDAELAFHDAPFADRPGLLELRYLAIVAREAGHPEALARLPSRATQKRIAVERERLRVLLRETFRAEVDARWCALRLAEAAGVAAPGALLRPSAGATSRPNTRGKRRPSSAPTPPAAGRRRRA